MELYVRSCHVTYTFHSESTLYNCLNIKELLARSRREIWSSSDCNWTRTHNHLVHKRTLNHLAKLVSLFRRVLFNLTVFWYSSRFEHKIRFNISTAGKVIQSSNFFILWRFKNPTSSVLVFVGIWVVVYRWLKYFSVPQISIRSSPHHSSYKIKVLSEIGETLFAFNWWYSVFL